MAAPPLVAALAALAACSGGADAPGGAAPSASAADGAAPAPGPGVSADGGALPPGDAGAVAEDAGPPGSPVAAHGALHVERGAIVDVRGTPVALRGMSLFWSQWGGAFWNAGAVATLRRDWGATVVRAAMGVEEGGYLADPAREKARVRTVVDAAIAEGLYVVVDWHDHAAHQHAAEARAFFEEMASAYGRTPNVIFEVWNEPVDVPWSTVKAYAETVTAAVRARGAANVVVVGSPHWSQDVDVAADDPVSDTNTAYAIHFYANTAAHQAPLRAKAEVALGKGLALFASEWGTSSADGNGAVNEAESKVWLDFLAQRGVGWCNWSLFDKPEAASALRPGASPTGPWGPEALTASGAFVKAALAPPP